MNNRSLFSTVLLDILLCVPHCVGQSNALFYGASSNSIGVAFVDTNLNTSVKAAIVADLQLCLNNSWGNQMELIVGADEPDLTGYLHHSQTSPHYPENIDFPDGVTSTPFGLALQIPKSLCDAYTNAFAFAASNSNIVAAAYDFVAFVSSSNFASLSSSALPNYVLQKNTTSNEIATRANAIISALQHQTYYPPSLLGFLFDESGPSATNLWVLVPCSSPLSYSGDKRWSPFPAVWHDGKWKFCVWRD